MRLPVLFSSALFLICSVAMADAAGTPSVMSSFLTRQLVPTDTVIPKRSDALNNTLSQRDLKPMILPGTMLDTTFSSLPAQSSAVGQAVPAWLRASVQGKPLYVIDGQSATANRLRGLRKEEVVSTYQLEGQKAQNLYGRNARNGIFIITTKSGLDPK